MEVNASKDCNSKETEILGGRLQREQAGQGGQPDQKP